MLQLPEEARDSMVNFLRNAMAPAIIGRELASIADHLASLKPVEEPKKEGE